MKRSGVILLVATILGGCTATNNYWENLKHTSSMRYFVSDEAKLERYTAACKKLGIEPDTDGWERCLLAAKKSDEDSANARSSAVHDRTRACSMDYRNC